MKTGQRLVWTFALERKREGVCCPLLFSSGFSSGRENSQPYTQPWCQHRAEIPSQGLMLLHIHACKSGPRAIALGSEISNLSINRHSCNFLWILNRRGMPNRRWVQVETFLSAYLRNGSLWKENAPSSPLAPLWSGAGWGFLSERKLKSPGHRLLQSHQQPRTVSARRAETMALTTVSPPVSTVPGFIQYLSSYSFCRSGFRCGLVGCFSLILSQRHSQFKALIGKDLLPRTQMLLGWVRGLMDLFIEHLTNGNMLHLSKQAGEGIR